MEHRWGRRHPVDIPVQLRWREGREARGQIIELSISGALVRTGATPPVLARVAVVLEAELVAACVTRHAAGAIALEWCELGNEPVNSVLLLLAQQVLQPERYLQSADPRPRRVRA